MPGAEQILIRTEACGVYHTVLRDGAVIVPFPPVRGSWCSRALASVCAGEQTDRLDSRENYLMGRHLPSVT